MLVSLFVLCAACAFVFLASAMWSYAFFLCMHFCVHVYLNWQCLFPLLTFALFILLINILIYTCVYVQIKSRPKPGGGVLSFSHSNKKQKMKIDLRNIAINERLAHVSVFVFCFFIFVNAFHTLNIAYKQPA